MGDGRDWVGWEIEIGDGAAEVAGPEFGEWIERIHPEDTDRVRGAVRDAGAGNGGFEAQFRVARRDGGVSTVAAKGVAVAGSRLIGITQDITSTELLQKIVDHIPVMLVLYDPNLGRFELNREAQRVLGWTDADANEGDFLAKVYPDAGYRASAGEYMQRLTPGWREFEVVAKDGSKIASEWANIRLSDERTIGIGIDVRALRESEERFRTMADNISPLAWMAHANGEIFWYNRRWLEYTGTTLEEVRGWGWQRAHHPEHVARVVERIRRSFETGEPFDDKFPLRGKDGRYRWFLSRALPIRDAARRITRWFGTNTDITELMEAEERYRGLFETMEAACHLSEILCDDEGGPTDWRFLAVNSAMEQILGAPRERLIGRTFRETAAGFDHDYWVSRLGEVALTGRPIRLDRYDAGRHWHCAAYSPRQGQFAVIFTDVTAAKQSEAAQEQAIAKLEDAVQDAHRSRSELEAVLQAMQDGVAVFDTQGSPVFINEAQVKIGAYPTGDEIPRGPREFARILELRRVDGSVVPLEERPVARVLRGESLGEVEMKGRRVDTGQEWHFSFSGEPVFEPDGRQALAVIIMRDITDRKRAEERARQSQKLESVGLLAGGIAHDFNNLLTGILGNASMALEDVEGAAAGRIREAIGSAERAANLTRQLLAYSGKGQFIVRDINVSEAVNEIAGLVEFSIPKSAQLSVNVQRRLPLVRMDPSQLQQVLMNLVINAGEAIGEGNAGKITVATSMTDVEQRFVDAAGEEVAPGRYVCVEVSDTGSGIDDGQRSRIFDPFFTTKFTGRGMGVAAVAGIVRSQKGGITVESKPGNGARFVVYLPASDGWVESAEGAGGRSTILVVDDEAAVRSFIGAALRREGYRVVSAADGREALAVMQREGEAIKAVVLDVIMPVMGGNDALPKMLEMRPDLKVLLTSGYSESEARRLCATYPGAAFIQKPYTAKTVVEALEGVVGR